MSIPSQRVRMPGRVPDPVSLAEIPTLHLGRYTTAEGVIDSIALVRFTTGEQPFARSLRLNRVRADAPMRPPDGAVLRMSIDEGRSTCLIAGDGWTLLVNRGRDRADICVTAATEDLLDTVTEATITDAVEPFSPDNDTPVGFWHSSAFEGGASRAERVIAAAAWRDIRRNYSAEAARAFDRLVALSPADVSGRLILLYGPPGTGKTTALRTLAREWRGWCQVDCVLDPERLFSEPGYLLDVAVGDEDPHPGSGGRRWRLLILEDCDELIRANAKTSSGQALSRLLNLTDGLLGQGRDVLVAITTNEEVGRLHPAVVRPGRCLAQIFVGALSYHEASAWLGGSATVERAGATLAELYGRRAQLAQIQSGQAPAGGGPYL